MNKPLIKFYPDSEIVREYRRHRDIKRVAKIFGISVLDARCILKAAGIKVVAEKKKKESALQSIGLTEKDFYNSDILER